MFVCDPINGSVWLLPCIVFVFVVVGLGLTNNNEFFVHTRYEYRTADAFLKDFNLMKSNAIKFNGTCVGVTYGFLRCLWLASNH